MWDYKICYKKYKLIVRQAFIKALPVTGSYIFVSMAYGLMMQKAGYGWIWSFFISMTVYTGAFQFLLVSFFSAGASFVTIGLTALFMNSRQFFYGLTFIDDFKKMGKKYPYMVHTMTDETYAVNCSMLLENKDSKNESSNSDRRNVMFFVALFSRISWMIGAILGGVIGQLIPVELKGIDFCMTALFITIAVDQWRNTKIHMPALLGIVIGIIFLLVLGAEYFLLPTLILVSGLLLLLKNSIEIKNDKKGMGDKDE